MSSSDPDCICRPTPRRIPHNGGCPRFDEDRVWSIEDRQERARHGSVSVPHRPRVCRPREREYAVWVFDPYVDLEPRILPAADRQQAGRMAALHGAGAKAVFRYTFDPAMPWEDA